MAFPSHLTGERDMGFSRSWRLTLTCLSIVLNATTAGGIFTFPILSPALSSRLRLTQPQLTSIVLAGMAGQYPFAAIAGSTIDRIGPWACSLASALLFSVGFGLFSLEIRNAPESLVQSSSASFIRLTFYFFLCGLGTLNSYFSALFCASKNFPMNSGMASGVSMGLFGLSPLILSLFASSFFTDARQNLDITGFTAFLAILTGVVNVIGAINLKIEPQPAKPELPVAPPAIESSHHSEVHSETTPLLNLKAAVQNRDRAWDVIHDYHFVLLAVITFLTLGPCEMVISNIGTISLALPPHPVTSDFLVTPGNSSTTGSSIATTQVRLLSLSNTFSRLLSGFAADFVSPVASYLPSGILALPRQHKVSRVAFLWGGCTLMICSFLWMALGVNSQRGVWAFRWALFYRKGVIPYALLMSSVGIGIAYGTTFTVLPSIISSIWGLQNLARNFGMITYAPFLATPSFSYLYAFISSAATETKDKEGYSEGVCLGKRCWRLTFYLCAGGSLVAASLSGCLWRRWRGRL